MILLLHPKTRNFPIPASSLSSQPEASPSLFNRTQCFVRTIRYNYGSACPVLSVGICLEPLGAPYCVFKLLLPHGALYSEQTELTGCHPFPACLVAGTDWQEISLLSRTHSYTGWRVAELPPALNQLPEVVPSTHSMTYLTV